MSKNGALLRQHVPLAAGWPAPQLAAMAPKLVVRRARRGEVPALLEDSRLAIGVDLAPLATVLGVFDHDPDAIWAFERQGRLLGAAAFLHLSRPGVKSLLDGDLDPSSPGADFLVPPSAAPAGIYFWSIYGTVAGDAGRIFTVLTQPRFARADLWAVPLTQSGRRFFTNRGFTPFPAARANMFCYRRVSSKATLVGTGGTP
jgi:hypothetical protein